MLLILATFFLGLLVDGGGAAADEDDNWPDFDENKDVPPVAKEGPARGPVPFEAFKAAFFSAMAFFFDFNNSFSAT